MKIDIDRVETVTSDTLIGDLVLFHPETADTLFSITGLLLTILTMR